MPSREVAALLEENAQLRANEDQLLAEVAQLREDLGTLEDACQHYIALHDRLPIGCMMLNRHGTVTDANRRAAILLQRGTRQLSGTPFLSLLVQEHRRRFLHHLVACNRSEELFSFEVALRRADATAIPVRLSMRAFGKNEGYALCLSDLREARLGESRYATTSGIAAQRSERDPGPGPDHRDADARAARADHSGVERDRQDSAAAISNQRYGSAATPVRGGLSAP